MNILVTGDAGFIGKHVFEALSTSGHDVIGADKKDGIDIADGFKFGSFIERLPEKPEIIVHIAGSCSTQKGLDNPMQDFRDNAIATANIIESARFLKIPVIYISTCKAQPNGKGIRTPYGLSKWIGEECIREFNACYGTEFVINRCGTVYGPGQEGSPESGWLAWFIKCAVEKKKLTVFGDGEQIRDVLYVTDLVQLITDQVENFDAYKNQTLEVGGGSENAITLKKAIDLLGLTDVSYGPERLGDTKVFCANLDEVSEINNWTPHMKWDVGIQKTYAYYAERFSKVS